VVEFEASGFVHQIVIKEKITALVFSGLRYNCPKFPRGRHFMPVYDYHCNDCRKSFEKVLTLREHDGENIKCPHCGSKNTVQEAAAFYAVTSKKSA